MSVGAETDSMDARLREHEDRLIAFIERARWNAPPSDDSFGELALHTFALQCDAIPAYGDYARYLGRGPDRVRAWHEIPAVPASAFKTHDLSAARPRVAASGAPAQGSEAGGGFLFETSGTSISRPGRVRLESTRLYEASLA